MGGPSPGATVEVSSSVSAVRRRKVMRLPAPSSMVRG